MTADQKTIVPVLNAVDDPNTHQEVHEKYEQQSEDGIDDHIPEGVQRMEAMTAVWSKGSLVTAYVGSAYCSWAS